MFGDLVWENKVPLIRVLELGRCPLVDLHYNLSSTRNVYCLGPFSSQELARQQWPSYSCFTRGGSSSVIAFCTL